MDNNCVKCEISSRSHMAVRSYGLDTDFGYVCSVTLPLEILGMTLGRSHDKPLDNEQLLCEILSRSNLAARSYYPNTDFGYVCVVTLTMEIWRSVFQLENEKGRAPGIGHFVHSGQRRAHYILSKTNFEICEKAQFRCHRIYKGSIWIQH